MLSNHLQLMLRNHCISQKPAPKSPLVDFKQGCEWWVYCHSLVEIQLEGQKIRGHSFICTLQCSLLPCDTICASAVFHMTAHDIYGKNAHYLYAKSSRQLPSISIELMAYVRKIFTAHEINANSAHAICANTA